MKNRSIPTSNNATGLRGLLNHLLGRSGVAATPARVRNVKVWDAQRDSYRDVDLHDRNDPLWSTARELYLFSKTGSRKTAA